MTEMTNDVGNVVGRLQQSLTTNANKTFVSSSASQLRRSSREENSKPLAPAQRRGGGGEEGEELSCNFRIT